MALQFYLDATNRLLQNPVPTPPLYTTTDLTSYINLGRQQVAADGQCIRATATASLIAAQNLYNFGLFQTFPLNTAAFGNIFFPANPGPGDTITLNGVVITFVASGASGNQINIGTTCGITIGLYLMAFLQASVNVLLTVAAYSVAGGPSTVTLSIVYKTTGTGGNAYTLAASAATVSGATLAGGGTSIQGISAVIAIRQMSVNTTGTTYQLMTNRPWAWFNRYSLSNGVAPTTGTPTQWAQQGIGAAVPGVLAAGTFGVSPAPSGTIAVKADAICIPNYLSTDVDPEVIPYPFTEAVPYYAAYYALMSSQRTQDATTMFERYKQFVKRAVDMTASPVYADNYQGGLGAQILGAKTQVTEAPQGGRQ